MRNAGLGIAALAALALVATAVARPVRGDDAPKAEYVGDRMCMRCHYGQFASWKKTAMARAMKSLAPTAEADDKALFDAKKAANLDPAKDYRTEEKCLKCHTTGYGAPGGYPADPKKDAAAAKLAAAMGAVSCEACHGPGSLYVKYKEPIVDRGADEGKQVTFTWEELSAYGLTRPDAALCAKCHNDQAPTRAAEPFSFEKAKTKVHEHPEAAKPAQNDKPGAEPPKK